MWNFINLVIFIELKWVGQLSVGGTQGQSKAREEELHHGRRCLTADCYSDRFPLAGRLVLCGCGVARRLWRIHDGSYHLYCLRVS